MEHKVAFKEKQYADEQIIENDFWLILLITDVCV